jgi:hypothetical protein
MKRILTALLMIILLGLSACTVPAAEDAEPTPTPDDRITDSDQIDPAPSPFPGNALTGSIQTFTVKYKRQITGILTNAMKSRKMLVNLDMRAFEKPDSNYIYMLNEHHTTILERNPDLEYATKSGGTIMRTGNC